MTVMYTVVLNCSVVDGGWSDWIKGACSKSCGGGTREVTRKCNNPTPYCRGEPCRGSDRYHEKCNNICCSGKI